MKSSFLRAALLSLLASAALLPLPMEARGAADPRRDNNNNNRPKDPAPGTSRPAQARPNPAAARNPLTGSSVNANRPKPANPRPANQPAARPANQPGPRPANPRPRTVRTRTIPAANQGKAKGLAPVRSTAPLPIPGTTPTGREPSGQSEPSRQPAESEQSQQSQQPSRPRGRLAMSPTVRPPSARGRGAAARPSPRDAAGVCSGKVTYPGQVSRPGLRGQDPQVNHRLPTMRTGRNRGTEPGHRELEREFEQPG